MPHAFASRDEPELATLVAAPIRTPHASRLASLLELPPKAARAAAALELETVGDLLDHVPRARREARTIGALAPGETATVVVEVRAIAQRPVRRRGMRPLVEATVADATGPMRATFFNQPWLESRYRPGTRLVLHGKYEGRNRFRVATHATTDEAVADAGDVPHYAASEGLSSTQILALVAGHRAELRDVVDALPGRLRARLHLAARGDALEAMHFGEPAESESGRRRLAFDELLCAQLALLARRAGQDARAEAIALDGPAPLTTRWLEHALPFALTDDQLAAIDVLRVELAATRPAQRLLMGEVGSGKTVVALYAMLRAVEHGAQAALMAPTETLAEQHFATIQRLVGEEPVTLALLTGSTPAARRTRVRALLESGECSLVVGTHALIEEAVRFRSLAVAVVDEQHRFGVRQRTALGAKAPGGLAPHVLHMTATPIPRTFALCEYGDLDHTRLRELPHGRRPVVTHVISGERERERAYERIVEEVAAGRQGFVVCPLVEAAEDGDEAPAVARAATEEFERLRNGELRDLRLVLLHGQMGHREKQAAMAAFAGGEADVLVATTVIEVGIDVPNATVMLVENAERFGISQLHQLRGRVGRGAHESLCLLFGPKGSPRLRALADHDDGFELAEIDLELRGEGELVGTLQSGAGRFKVAQLPGDEVLLAEAHAWARALIAEDARLEAPDHVLLADRVAELYGEIAAHPIAA